MFPLILDDALLSVWFHKVSLSWYMMGPWHLCQSNLYLTGKELMHFVFPARPAIFQYCN